jgi:hypothetical protein
MGFALDTLAHSLSYCTNSVGPYQYWQEGVTTSLSRLGPRVCVWNEQNKAIILSILYQAHGRAAVAQTETPG